MAQDDQATGIVLFAHGSSVEEANAGVRELAKQVQALGPYGYVCAAFLELAHPTLAEAVTEAAQAGLQRVIVIPYFLTVGIHLRRDLPSLIAPQKQKYPDLMIEVSQSLEGHPLMASIILERAQEVACLKKNRSTSEKLGMQ
jgi:sirohydrochlorin ferrochelatase